MVITHTIHESNLNDATKGVLQPTPRTSSCLIGWNMVTLLEFYFSFSSYFPHQCDGYSTT